MTTPTQRDPAASPPAPERPGFAVGLVALIAVVSGGTLLLLAVVWVLSVVR